MPARLTRLCGAFLAVLVGVVSAPDPAEARGERSRMAACLGFDERALQVNSTVELHRLVEQVIALHWSEKGIPWHCLVQSFDALATNTRTLVHPKGGPVGSDVYAFSIDRRADLKPPYRLPMGSSGQFVALVRAMPSGSVAIVGQGGVPRWLELGGPARIAPLIDPLAD
ncbi:MAG: hypothetical protein AAFQ88_11815 [Pseudomonadota bacterium]